MRSSGDGRGRAIAVTEVRRERSSVATGCATATGRAVAAAGAAATAGAAARAFGRAERFAILAQPPSSIAIVASASRPTSWDFGYDWPDRGRGAAQERRQPGEGLGLRARRGGGRARDLGAVLEGEGPVAELDLLARVRPGLRVDRPGLGDVEEGDLVHAGREVAGAGRPR